MPKKNKETNRLKKRKSNQGKKLSKKKEKQKLKREKLLNIKYNPISEPSQEFKDYRKYYLGLALMNISQILAEQGDYTWGGVVDPNTYQVIEDYWPGTDIPISNYDRSRINSMSTAVFTGDQTMNFNKMVSYVPNFIKGEPSTPLFNQLNYDGVNILGGKLKKK